MSTNAPRKELVATLDAKADGTTRLPPHALHLCALLHRALHNTSLYRVGGNRCGMHVVQRAGDEGALRMSIISNKHKDRLKVAVNFTSQHCCHTDLQLRAGVALVLRVEDQLRWRGGFTLDTTFLNPACAVG